MMLVIGMFWQALVVRYNAFVSHSIQLFSDDNRKARLSDPLSSDEKVSVRCGITALQDLTSSLLFLTRPSRDAFPYDDSRFE